MKILTAAAVAFILIITAITGCQKAGPAGPQPSVSTETPVFSATVSATVDISATMTATPSCTATINQTATEEAVLTADAILSFTRTPTETATQSETFTQTMTFTLTPTKTSTPGPCDTGLSPATAGDYGLAMDICYGLDSVEFVAPSNPAGSNITGYFGNVITPRSGSFMVALSTGQPFDANEPGYVARVPGVRLVPTETPIPHPARYAGQILASTCPYSTGCPADEANVYDMTEMRITLTAPPDATGFAYDFYYFNSEFPAWVCSAYYDKFLVLMQGQLHTGNISFDSLNKYVTSRSFFGHCQATGSTGSCCPNGTAELAGTGYEAAAGTGWLTTSAPVNGGETFTLRFIIFDASDWQDDSTVLIDNFRWMY